MIKFFRRIRQRLLTENKFSKYLLYAIGEILLVVIGIIIAVSIGEWRQQIKDKQEVSLLYQNLQYELNQDQQRLDTLIKVYGQSRSALESEIGKLQLDSYNQDALYNGFSSWMLYTTASQFLPQESVYKEIISNAKLKLISNDVLKTQLLKLYNELYPEMSIRRIQNGEMLMEFTTLEISDSFRWLNAFNKDGRTSTNINLKVEPVRLDDSWLRNKQSDKFRRFENALAMRYAIYSGNLERYENIKIEVNKLDTLINTELSK